MKILSAMAERSPDSFTKIFVKVKSNWFSKPKLYYSYKVTTKFERQWVYTVTQKEVSKKFANKLSEAFDNFRDCGNKIHQIK
jgi:hypothetical protein